MSKKTTFCIIEDYPDYSPLQAYTTEQLANELNLQFQSIEKNFLLLKDKTSFNELKKQTLDYIAEYKENNKGDGNPADEHFDTTGFSNSLNSRKSARRDFFKCALTYLFLAEQALNVPDISRVKLFLSKYKQKCQGWVDNQAESNEYINDANTKKTASARTKKNGSAYHLKQEAIRLLKEKHPTGGWKYQIDAFKSISEELTKIVQNMNPEKKEIDVISRLKTWAQRDLNFQTQLKKLLNAESGLT